MKSTLSDFHAGIDQLVMFLERTEQEQRLILLLNERKSELPPHEIELLSRIVEAATNTKQYMYTVSIVSLYGLLERLVDNLVIRFVVDLSKICKSFDDLPDAIRKNHLQYSLDLADALQRDAFRTETTHEKVIANLHSCLSGADSYQLNGLAFALHRGNINLGRITEMLTGIGVQHHLRRVVRTPTFSDFLREMDPERSIQSLNDEELKALLDPIDDLVERRNSISHGVVQIDNIESIALLKERCAFVRAYGVGVFEQLQHDALKYAALKGVAQPLGNPIVVYNHNIVCFESSCRISVGDLIFSLTSDALEPVRVSPVANLQINRVNHQEIAAESPIQFGVQVHFYANDGYEYYSLPDDFL